MIVLLSPSKTQDFITPPSLFLQGKDLPFPQKTNFLADLLEEYSSEDLQKLMKISPKLAERTVQDFQEWKNSRKEKPAISTFRGDVYRGFELKKYTEEDFSFLEKTVRILSGFYGMITPNTLIRPYRLEMGTRLSLSQAGKEYKNLVSFWKEDLTKKLAGEVSSKEIIVNLASLEYSNALDLSAFGDQVLDIDFKVEKKGILKTIGIFAKRQRGRMANWIVQKRITETKHLEEYQNDGFVFTKDLSQERKMVFVKKQEKE